MTGRWKTSTRRSRLPPNWDSEIRPIILARDQGVCHVCRAPGADQVDHVQRGDDHHPSNLAAICGPCHRAKSAREGAAAAAIVRAKQPKRARDPERHPGLL